MNLDKIDVSLAHAFQESDGPFEVVARLEDGGVLSASLDKTAIGLLSEKPWVIEIKIATRNSTRRKTMRPGDKDRRWD